MKKLLLISIIFAHLLSHAQIVTLPDSAFKSTLISASVTEQIAQDENFNWITVDVNGDSEIQESEANLVYHLFVDHKFINSLDGIDSFTNLVSIDCSYNNLTNLNINNANLISISASNNNIGALDISNNVDLLYLSCSDNDLTTIDVSSNIMLTYLNFGSNSIETIDLIANVNLSELYCGFNSLTNLNLMSVVVLTKLFCNNNNLTSLNLDVNTELTNLNCDNNTLNFIDISNHFALTNISCKSTNISVLDISPHVNLVALNCENNALDILNTNTNIALRYLLCANNNISNVNFDNNPLLTSLNCSNNNLNTLDLSANTILNQLTCTDNPNLNYINLKNGNNTNFIFGNFSNFENLPSLQNVCVDELNNNLVSFIQAETMNNIVFSTYCSFSPTNTNTISGIVKFDENLDGCNSSIITIPNKLVTATNGAESISTFTQQDGSYELYINTGVFNTELTGSLSSNVSVAPISLSNTFVDFGNDFTANFCVTPTSIDTDLSVSIIPTTQVRPGFGALYRIIYTNNGTAQVTGSVELFFDDSKLSFTNASPLEGVLAGNLLTFNYADLSPFETRIIDLEFQVFAPPITTINDELEFTVSINPSAGDLSPNNNSFIYNQVVVDSYDPNDIHVLEGAQISFTAKNESLHYLIRFQNTGTADAINVVVKNELDANLDWSTLELETTSHQSRVVVTNGNKIEFIFENIHLPDSTTDEQNSHGFIAYKIKPISNIVVNQLIPNKADIFFDLNEAIETNIASTKYVSVLDVNQNLVSKFNVYPSPTTSILNVSTKTDIAKIEIYNKLGQLMLTSNHQNNIDISSLSAGLYLCRITDVHDNFGVQKVIKK